MNTRRPHWKHTLTDPHTVPRYATFLLSRFNAGDNFQKTADLIKSLKTYAYSVNLATCPSVNWRRVVKDILGQPKYWGKVGNKSLNRRRFSIIGVHVSVIPPKICIFPCLRLLLLFLSNFSLSLSFCFFIIRHFLLIVVQQISQGRCQNKIRIV